MDSQDLLAAGIAERYHQVLERIERAARSVGRDPAAVRLVTVTKGHPVERIRLVYAAGARIIGENYADEAVEKIAACADLPGLEWHMIGHIQSRKARLVAERFTWVHSLDSLKLARRLSAFAGEAGRTLPVLLECNVSGEETKFGWPAWDETNWPALLEQLGPLVELPNLAVRGLMTMAPYDLSPEAARPHFVRLRRLREYLAARLPAPGRWDELSMGMSGDFEPAIEEGATLVRIGTAILGPRPCAI